MANYPIVLLSGGQDSATCLIWALKQFDDEPIAISFKYGQRHFEAENHAVANICRYVKIRRHVVDLTGAFKALTDNSLINHTKEIKFNKNTELPTTFVPGRNILFLTVAAAFGYQLSKDHREPINLVIGVNHIDYSNYPDCRPYAMSAMQNTLHRALDCPVQIHTPLIEMSKAEIVQYFYELRGTDQLMAMTHSCYEGVVGGCGSCPACELRAKGFAEAGRIDPSRLKEGTDELNP